MKNSEHSATAALIGGPYHRPMAKLGERRVCLVRGEVTITGESDAIIPWPLCKKVGKPGLLVTSELVRALKIESTQAIAQAWGINPHTVAKWRSRLGIDPKTPGHLRLKQKLAPKN